MNSMFKVFKNWFNFNDKNKTQWGSKLFLKNNNHFLKINSPIIYREELVQQNSITFRCVQFIADSLNSVKIIDHLDIINFNPILIEDILVSFLIHGNAILLYDEENKNLISLDLKRIQIKKEGEHLIYFYNIQEDISLLKFIIKDKESNNNIFQLIPNKVVHIRNNFVGNKIWGKSYITSIENEILTINYINNYIRNYHKTGGRVSGLFYVDPNISQEGLENLKNFDIDSDSTLIVERGQVSWQPIGNDPKSMNSKEAVETMSRSIASFFGIPFNLLGFGDFIETAKTYRESRVVLFNDCLYPLLNKIIFQINDRLKKITKQDCNLKIDWDSFITLKIKGQDM